MRRVKLEPTRADIAVADAITRHEPQRMRRAMRVVTWLADEKLLYAASALLWLASKRGTPQQREQADHLLVAVIITNVVPHLLKGVIDQQRPDRRVGARLRRFRRNGNASDAFPSGHAMHVGAIASAVSWIEPKAAPWVWLAGLGIASSRVLLLAHWASDVVIGIAAGAAIERALRPLTRRLVAR